MPGLVPSEFMHTVDSPLDRHVTANHDALKEIATLPLPLRILTQEEEARVDAIQSELGKAVDMGCLLYTSRCV